MSTDAESREPRRPRPNLWRLPEVLSVDAIRVQYQKPKIRYVGLERVEHNEAVELLVRTANEFPARALSPAIFVGDVPIVDYEVAGENLYRFLAFEYGVLKERAPISIGWPQFPQRKRETKFLYEIKGEERK